MEKKPNPKPLTIEDVQRLYGANTPEGAVRRALLLAHLAAKAVKVAGFQTPKVTLH